MVEQTAQIKFRQPGDTHFYIYRKDLDSISLFDLVKDVFQKTTVRQLEVVVEIYHPESPISPLTVSVEPVKPEAARVDGGGKTTTTPSKPLSVLEAHNECLTHGKNQYTKVCPHCKTRKSVDDFTKKKNGKPASWCRDCVKVAAKACNEKKKRIAAKALNDPAPSQSEPVLPSDGGDHRGPTPGQQAPTAAIKRPTPRWTKNDDAILKTQYDSIGIVGVHAERLLSDDFTLTEIKQRCQHLRIIDAAGVRIQRQLHKKDDNTQMEEDLDV